MGNGEGCLLFGNPGEIWKLTLAISSTIAALYTI